MKPVSLALATVLVLFTITIFCPAAGNDDKAIYGLVRGDRFRRGSFDEAGNFIPREEGSFPVSGGFSQLTVAFCNWMFHGTYRALEHRSGRLIKGVLTHGGTFVPDVGSRLIALADYHPDPKEPRKTPRIWNLPSSWPKVPYDACPSRHPHPLEAPKPEPIGPPAGYTYRPYSERLPGPWVAHVIGKKFELGHFDDAGDFVPEYELPMFAVSRTMPQVIAPRHFREPFYYNLPEQRPNETVYEYRFGRLLAGILKVDGTFVPDSYSTVLPFTDYDPVKSRRRIYNLPGILTKDR